MITHFCLDLFFSSGCSLHPRLLLNIKCKMPSERGAHHPRAHQCVGGDWKNRTNMEWDVSRPTLTSICTVSSAHHGWDSPWAANAHTHTHTHLLFSNYGSNYLGLRLLRQARAFLRAQRLVPLVVEMVCCRWAVATGDTNQQSWSRKSKISDGPH